MKKTIATALSLILLLTSSVAFAAEGDPQGTFELRGTVTDEARGYIPAVPVILDDGKGNRYTAETDERGHYRFTGIKPGLYMLAVEVEGFAPVSEQVDLTSRRAAPLDIELKVFISDQLEVKNDAAGISSEPDKNLSSITLSEKDLEALPDDPEELLQTLRQMAGAAGGADEAAVYVGGFRERGRIPPKEAIQMIRINSNPFAAEFSEPGQGRIEIITKPGSDTFHGGFQLRFNDESLNARNAFAPSRAALQTRNYGGNFSGPIISKRWGFFLDVDRREVDENEVINATVLDPVSNLPEQFSASVLTPNRMFNFSIRTDFLATKKHTIGLQYRHTKNEWENLGLQSGFDLPERAFNRSVSDDTIRLSLTSIATEHAVNEARLELSRRSVTTRALSDATAVIVLDAFFAGGNQGSLFLDNTNDELEFSDYLTYTYKKHTIKAGVRAEGTRLDNLNRSNFGGTFTFGTDVERNAAGVPIDASGNPITDPARQEPVPISALERYRRVLEGRPGYRPSQFSINRGDPFVGFTQWEMSWFVQDDWRLSQRLTLSYGLRHEFQTNLDDKINLAPRFGLAWVADKKSTVRAGAGIFYNRLDTGITFDTLRLDGQRQQQFIISSPNFFLDIPDSFGGVGQAQPTMRIKAEGLNAPYSIITTVGYERQLPWKLFGAVSYTWNRGIHLLRTRNINAPVGIDSSNRLILPFPGEGPIYQFESTGISNRHELRTIVRTNISRTFSMFGAYTLASTRGDTDSAYTSPANSYDLSSEYGRSSIDARHQMFIGGSISIPWNMRISPYISANSGRPFNITTGRDDNRDTLFSDRPAFALPGDEGAIITRFGAFNPSPRPGDEIIPRNYGEGPGFFSVNFNISKTIGFGDPTGGLPAQATRGSQQGQQGGQNQAGQNQGQNQRGDNRRVNTGGPGGQGGFGGVGGGRGGGFGGPGGGGMGGFFGGDNRHKYNLTLGLDVRNLFNRTNEAGFNGVITSNVFGLANRALQSRRIEAWLRFSF